MGKGFKLTRSEDALTVTIEGDVRNPEPTHAIIKFPGGVVEVARCSDGSYWAHLSRDPHAEYADEFEVVASRVEYGYPEALFHGVGTIPAQDRVDKLAVCIARKTAPKREVAECFDNCPPGHCACHDGDARTVNRTHTAGAAGEEG